MNQSETVGRLSIKTIIKYLKDQNSRKEREKPSRDWRSRFYCVWWWWTLWGALGVLNLYKPKNMKSLNTICYVLLDLTTSFYTWSTRNISFTNWYKKYIYQNTFGLWAFGPIIMIVFFFFFFSFISTFWKLWIYLIHS